MAVVLRSSATGPAIQPGSSGIFAMPKPSTVAQGDLLVAVFYQNAVGDPNDIQPANTSWTRSLQLDGDWVGNEIVFHRYVDGTEPDEFTFTTTVSSQMLGVIGSFGDDSAVTEVFSPAWDHVIRYSDDEGAGVYVSSPYATGPAQATVNGTQTDVNSYIKFGYDLSAIAAAVGSDTVTKVEVGLRRDNQVYGENSKTLCVGTHEHGTDFDPTETNPGTYAVPQAGDIEDRWDTLVTPGQTKWFELPTEIYDDLTSGSTRGIILGCQTEHEYPEDYLPHYIGWARGVTGQLRITHTENDHGAAVTNNPGMSSSTTASTAHVAPHAASFVNKALRVAWWMSPTGGDTASYTFPTWYAGISVQTADKKMMLGAATQDTNFPCYFSNWNFANGTTGFQGINSSLTYVADGGVASFSDNSAYYNLLYTGATHRIRLTRTAAGTGAMWMAASANFAISDVAVGETIVLDTLARIPSTASTSNGWYAILDQRNAGGTLLTNAPLVNVTLTPGKWQRFFIVATRVTNATQFNFVIGSDSKAQNTALDIAFVRVQKNRVQATATSSKSSGHVSGTLVIGQTDGPQRAGSGAASFELSTTDTVPSFSEALDNQTFSGTNTSGWQVLDAVTSDLYTTSGLPPTPPGAVYGGWPPHTDGGTTTAAVVEVLDNSDYAGIKLTDPVYLEHTNGTTAFSAFVHVPSTNASSIRVEMEFFDASMVSVGSPTYTLVSPSTSDWQNVALSSGGSTPASAKYVQITLHDNNAANVGDFVYFTDASLFIPSLTKTHMESPSAALLTLGTGAAGNLAYTGTGTNKITLSNSSLSYKLSEGQDPLVLWLGSVNTGFNPEPTTSVVHVDEPPVPLPPIRRRYIAQDILTKEFLHWDVPLSDDQVTVTLSGPNEIKGTITPDMARELTLGSGRVLEPWRTMLHCEENGQFIASCILMPGDMDYNNFNITAEGFTGYPHGMPYIGDYSKTNVDPIDVVREIWRHLQSYPEGNIGVGIQTEAHSPTRLGNEREQADDPNSPLKPYTLAWYDIKDCGSTIDEMARSAPFEYVEKSWWKAADPGNIQLFMDIAVPRAGTFRENLRFAEGENIVDAVTLTEIEDWYANGIIGQGAGEGRDKIQEISWNWGTNGRVRRTHVYSNERITDRQQLKNIINRELTRRASVHEISSIVIDGAHPNAPRGSFGPGDDILVQVEIPWVGDVAIKHRIISYTHDRASDLMELELQRSDSFLYGNEAPSDNGGGGF